jgi:NADPH:quinone reductase-like Zn-dependent oxidoreductase
MRAIVVEPGEKAPTLALREVPAPQPGPNDLLVSVRAVGLNRAELARALPKPGQINIVGMEAAGEVVAVGRDVRGFAVGDRVMSMGTSCYAEQVVFDHRVAFHVPASLTWEQAASCPTLYQTAHDALVNAEFKAGDTVLITAVTAGVGIAAVQIARLLGAAQVIGTSRSDEKLARMAALGLDASINSAREDVAARVKALTGERGADVILDNVGAGMLATNLAAAAIKSRMVTIGRLGGKVEEIDLDIIALKRMKLVGVTFRTRSIEEKSELARRFADALMAPLSDGRLQPVIDRIFPFEDALAAQEYMRSNQHLGKIVLRIGAA